MSAHVPAVHGRGRMKKADRGPVKRTTITLEDTGDEDVNVIRLERRPAAPPTPAAAPDAGDDASDLLDTVQVGKRLRCSPRHVRRLDEDGLLPRPVRLGRLVRWRRSELLRWLEAGCPPRAEWEASGVGVAAPAAGGQNGGREGT